MKVTIALDPATQAEMQRVTDELPRLTRAVLLLSNGLIVKALAVGVVLGVAGTLLIVEREKIVAALAGEGLRLAK